MVPFSSKITCFSIGSSLNLGSVIYRSYFGCLRTSTRRLYMLEVQGRWLFGGRGCWMPIYTSLPLIDTSFWIGSESLFVRCCIELRPIDRLSKVLDDIMHRWVKHFWLWVTPSLPSSSKVWVVRRSSYRRLSECFFRLGCIFVTYLLRLENIILFWDSLMAS